MSESRLERIETLFHAALDLPPTLRDAYLEQHTDDAELRNAVKRLLQHHTEGDEALHAALHGAVAKAASPALPGIGGYRVLRELGAGGMGTVFLAERAIGETQQQVAIKLIRGFPTQDARMRLVRERSLLAGLNHPNIAGLIDGGETADAQPYLVMEYVEGLPLPDYCREQALDLRARLRLFAQLCRAVQHAHQRLIVHRDIKPGNVLVRADGTPVLLDFGIGKLLDSTQPDATATRVFTPAYAAPEQRLGRAVTTATDIYGLGCVLFELLTDCLVADVGGGERGIPAPSSAVTTSVARALRGELDTVVAKATHAEPERRYNSAQALADDVENWLAGRPLLAAPDKVAYRMRKFLQRHRVAAVVVVAALAVASVFVWRLAVERSRALAAEARAEREVQSMRRARNFLVSLFEAAAPGNTLGKPLSARELIDEGSAKIAEELKDEPETAARLDLTIADVYAALGDPKAAIASAENALKLASGDTPERALLRADILLTLSAEYDNTERFDEARRAAEEALSLRRRHAPEGRAKIASNLTELGAAALRSGDNEQARDYYQRAMDTFATLAQVDAADRSQVLRGLAEVDINTGKLDAAVQRGEEAVRVLEALPPASPERLEAWRVLARAQVAQGDAAVAAATLEHAIAVARATLGDDSYKVASLENDLAVALNGVGRYSEAIAHLQASIAISAKRRPGDKVATGYDRMNLGSIKESLGDYAGAETLMRGAIADIEAATPDEPQLDFFRGNLARTLMLRGDVVQARSLIERALAGIAARDGEKSFGYAFQLYRLARIEMVAGHIDAAETTLRDSLSTLDAMLPPQHALRAQLGALRAQIAQARGDLATAQREIEGAMSMLTGLKGDPNDLAVMHLRLAQVIFARGELVAARRELELALPVLQQNLLPEANEVREARALQVKLAAPATGLQ